MTLHLVLTGLSLWTNDVAVFPCTCRPSAYLRQRMSGQTFSSFLNRLAYYCVKIVVSPGKGPLSAMICFKIIFSFFGLSLHFLDSVF